MMEQYDERQTFFRYKYGYQSFLVLTGLIVLHFLVCDKIYVWAEPKVAVFAAVMLSIGYYLFRTTLVGAEKGYRRKKRTSVLSSILGVFLGFSMGPSHFRFIEDGKATMMVVFVILVIDLILFAAAYIIRRQREKRKNGEEAS